MEFDANAEEQLPTSPTAHSNGLVFWEPWQPEVGARVRVRYPGECNVDWGSVGDRLGEYPGHPEEFDGVTGRVFQIDPHYGAHKYAVLFDLPVAVVRKDDAKARGAHFAAIELEPLDGATINQMDLFIQKFTRPPGR
jgi:hypothetical protein